MFAAAGLLAAATLAAYANSFAAPFVYDDLPSITENLTLRSFTAACSPPAGGLTVSGRPVLNLSLALNYALGGHNVFGYHLANLLIHLAAGLALFGLVRRTLSLPALAPRFGAQALPVAFTIGALWLLHPLQTEAVTYVVQRAESLMGLCYLATLYAFVRAAGSDRPWRWYTVSLAACLLGMATKENMVSAPLAVLLFDRTFCAGSFAAAWRKRAGFYLGLAATWLPLAWLVATTGGDRGGSAGFSTSLTFGEYVLTQFPAIVRYLSLSFWPQPLVFDYGVFWIEQPLTVLPYALVVLALGGASLWAIARKSAFGFLGGGFFAILAPSSLVPVVMQRIVEHRMYLPLAAVATVVALAAFRLGGRRALLGLLAAAVALGAATFRRNHDYRSNLALWEDTLAKHPSATAHLGVASVLATLGRPEEALRHTDAALRLQPRNILALANRGNLLTELGRVDEAVAPLEEALRLKPDYAGAHLNLGVALDLLHRPSEALPHHEAALRLMPESARAHNNLGDALCRAGRSEAGLALLEAALQLDPSYVEPHYNLAAALARAGRGDEARAHFEAAIALKPDNPAAQLAWAHVLLESGDREGALAHFRSALALAPADAAMHYDYGTALAGAGRFDAALVEFQAAVRLRPGDPAAHNNLANTLLALGRETEAVPHYEAALRLEPNNARAHDNLGLALARLGRLEEAAGQFAEAVRLAPGSPDAREHLARAQAELRAK